MLTSIYEYTALIQFVGAFNFAFVYKKFETHLQDNILNSDKRLDKQFEDINADINPDMESIEQMECVTVSCNGKTINTQKALEALRNRYKNLKKRHAENRDNLKRHIHEHYTFRNAGILFLALGLYSIIDLFYIGHLMHTHNDYYCCLSFFIFNMLVSFFVVYFIASEIIYFIEGDKTRAFFKPTYLGTVITVFIMLSISVLSPLLMQNPIILNHLEDCHNIMVWSGIILPLMGFIVCIIGVGILYWASSKKNPKSRIASNYGISISPS